MTMSHLSNDNNGSDRYVPSPISYYAEQGWKLIPCHGISPAGCNCGNSHSGRSDGGKHPMISDWPLNATSDSQQLHNWFGNESRNNVAVVCDQSGLVVIDIDPRNGGDESFIALESFLEGAIPITVTALTGEYTVKGKKVRGRHLYFKADSTAQYIKDFSRLGYKGIDVKSNGYVLLSPSLHSSGVYYEWEDGLSPYDIEIAELSTELKNVMIKGNKNHKLPINSDHIDFTKFQDVIASSSAKRELANQVERIAKKTMEGQRNVALNESAFVMGQFIAGGQISLDEARNSLFEAARIAYAGENADAEIASVLRINGGGFEAGAQLPIYDITLEGSSASEEVMSIDEAAFMAKMNVVNWEELWADTSEEIWFVDGLICAERGHTIYSDPGVGKSLLVREICACLASGKPVLGLPPKEPIRILYIDHENIPKTDIRRSLIDMGFDWPELKENFILMSFPEFAPFDLPKGGQELKRVLEIVNPDLVVMDTASRTIQGKENDNDTWIDFYNYTGKVLKFLGIAYIRIDHTGKNANAGPRGGSAKMGDVDLVWYLKEEETDSKFTLENEKHRVPLERLEYTLRRETEPLRHTISSAMDWTSIMKRHLRFLEIVGAISDYMATHPSQKLGLNSLYKAMQKICKDNGYSRRDFDAARQEYLRIQEEDAA
jgi:hypothetical protein